MRSRKGHFPRRSIRSRERAAYRGAWQETIKAAEEANDPGRFTAFIGYEWTSNTGGNNLHRNVIFRDNGDKAQRRSCRSSRHASVGSDNPRDLWKWMQAYEDKTGGDVLAIAHNGNLSNGRMFPMIEPCTGKPIDSEYAETRAKWERLYEATQIKGDGETHPFLSPNDEFANFERWDKGNLDLSELKTPDMLAVRICPLGAEDRAEARRRTRRQSLQVRHGRLDRRSYRPRSGRGGQFLRQDFELRAKRRSARTSLSSRPRKRMIMGWETTASGYAAVWATENTREAIFDAMERRETYATTGPRMMVRFFGGYDFQAADAQTRSPR